MEAFFDLLKKASDTYQRTSIVRKRKIVKILFSNLIIWTNWAYLVVKPEFKELFTDMVDPTQNKSKLFARALYDYIKQVSEEIDFIRSIKKLDI